MAKFNLKEDNSNLAEALNAMFQDARYWSLLEDMGKRDPTGLFGHLGGPFWADASETEGDYLNGFHQYVGHNQNKEILTVGDEESSITYCDVLGFIKDYKIIEIC